MPTSDQEDAFKESIRAFIAQGGSINKINEITAQISNRQGVAESKSQTHLSLVEIGTGSGYGAESLIKEEKKEKEPKPFLKSEQIIAACTQNSDGKYSASAKGRGPSIFERTDGDHKIAIGFLEKAFLHFVKDIEIDPETDLDELKRGTRASIHDLISIVATFNPKHRDNLYEGLSDDLRQSKSRRIPNSTLTFLQEEADLSTDEERKKYYEQLLDREQRYNGEMILDYLVESYRRYATFCNKLPGNAFVKIPGLEAPGDESSRVRGANRLFLDIELNQYSRHLPTAALSEKSALHEDQENISNAIKEHHLFRKVIEGMSDSFFLLQIPQELLEDHKNKTKEELLNTLQNKAPEYTRRNTQDELEESLAQYITVMNVSYPNTMKRFGSDRIVDQFIKRVIDHEHKIKNPINEKEDITIRQGWPQFANDDKIAEITRNTKQRVEAIQRDAGENHYTKYEGYISGKSTPIGNRTRSNSELERIRTTTNQLLLSQQEPEDLLEALGDKIKPEQEQSRKAFDQLSMALEGDKKFDKREVIELLIDLRRDINERREMITSEQFLEEFNDILNDLITIKYPVDTILESDNYAISLESTINQMQSSENLTITKNELISTLARNCKEQKKELGMEQQKSENFVKKLNLEAISETKSFTERIQSSSKSRLHEL